ncbi:MAG: glycosyltransferase family 2 protein [bacterium]|nr:glycosyltransferase family 2 protein [bacterium]
MDKKISVVLATYNEEKNIGACLESVKILADEIVVVDGSSSDKTREIARSFEARVIEVRNEPIFHINKEKALRAASNEWVLQLDADEQVSPKLREEIKRIVGLTDEEIEQYQRNLPNRNLFLRHQRLLEKRDGAIGTKEGSYVAFFVPRLNYFLGKFLRYGGVYPDGVIRLIKKSKSHFPAKSVHEQIVVDGRVGWLQNDLIHLDSPTFERYLRRNSRYVDLIAQELKESRVGKNLLEFLNYFLLKPTHWFLLTQIRHKGILDGFPGITFSFFSALRFPRAYWRYLKKI